MTHDHERNGTTTRFAALDSLPRSRSGVLGGTVLGRCMQRHTHQEFIRFLNAIEKAVPAGKVIHAVADDYATRKHPRVRAWARPVSALGLHFTPTSASWLNAVATFFSTFGRSRIRRGIFRSIVDLQAAINRYIAEPNDDPKPFVRTQAAPDILAKAARLPEPSV